MEKVKITAEQERVMKRIDVYEGEQDVFDFLNKLTEQDFPYSKEISSNLDEQKEVRNIIKAFLHGYEVEPEFKVGDIVENIRNGHLGQIYEVNGLQVSVRYIGDREGKLNPYYVSTSPDKLKKIEGEKADKLKEKLWWDKHDRDVWEIREDDTLEYLGNPYIVDSFDSENVYFKTNKSISPIKESFESVKKHFKVFCFAEDRKDIKFPKVPELQEAPEF